MDLDALGRNLNWVDWTVLAVLALFTYGGLRRGLLLGSLDLLGLGVPLVAAWAFYQPAAQWLLSSLPFPLPEAIAHIATFSAILFIAPALYGIGLGFAQRLVSPAFRGLETFRGINAALGIVPGFAKGAVAASIVLVPLTVFPLMPDVTRAIDRSVVATQLVQVVGRVAPVTQTRFQRPEDQIPAMSPLPGIGSNPIPQLPIGPTRTPS